MNSDTRAALSVLTETGCVFLLLHGRSWQNDQGFYVVPVVNQQDTEDPSQHILVNIKTSLHLVNYRPANDEEISEFEKHMASASIGSAAEINWYLHAMGKYNDALANGLPAYFDSSWWIRDLASEQLDDIFDLLDAWEWLLFYDTPRAIDTRTYAAHVIIQAKLSPRFQDYKALLSSRFGLDHWDFHYATVDLVGIELRPIILSHMAPFIRGQKQEIQRLLKTYDLAVR